MSDRERAFGWLVLGDGMSRQDAAHLAATAPIGAIEIWAKKQRRAVLGLYCVLTEAMEAK
jgi:hypothetical protein